MMIDIEKILDGVNNQPPITRAVNKDSPNLYVEYAAQEILKELPVTTNEMTSLLRKMKDARMLSEQKRIMSQMIAHQSQDIFWKRMNDQAFRDNYDGSSYMFDVAVIECLKAMFGMTNQAEQYKPHSSENKEKWDVAIYRALIQTGGYAKVKPSVVSSLFCTEQYKKKFEYIIALFQKALMGEVAPKPKASAQPKPEPQQQPQAAPQPKAEQKHEEEKKETASETEKVKEVKNAAPSNTKQENVAGNQEKPAKDSSGDTGAKDVPIDPAEMEHPEDDAPVAEEPKKEEQDNKQYVDAAGMKFWTLGQAMKPLINEEDKEDEKSFLKSKAEYDPFYIQNRPYLDTFQPLNLLDGWIKEVGGKEKFYFITFPFGDLIGCEVYFTDPTGVTEVPHWVLVDPNVLYRNGYNVLSAVNNGKILDEDFVSLTEENKDLVMKLLAGKFKAKDRKFSRKGRPSCVKKVFELVNFSTLGAREPFETKEWNKLITVLYSVINAENIQYRMSLTQYDSPDKFVLVSDSSVLPLSTRPEDLAMIRTNCEVVISYDVEKYGEKLYEVTTSSMEDSKQ